MASQLARGFLAEQDLERFVREEHGGNRAAAARAASVVARSRASRKYFRAALGALRMQASPLAALARAPPSTGCAPRRAWRSATLIDASAMRRARWPWTRTISNH